LLSGDDDQPTSSRLGWNTWLHTDIERKEAVRVDVDPAPHLR
jgi:hypothetical protein